MKFKKELCISFWSNFPLLQYGLYIVHKTKMSPKTAVIFYRHRLTAVESHWSRGHVSWWVDNNQATVKCLQFVPLCSFAVRLKQTLHQYLSFPNLPEEPDELQTSWSAFHLQPFFFWLVVSDCQFMNFQLFSDFEQVTAACTSLKYCFMLKKTQCVSEAATHELIELEISCS
jgi:hypothetical protein